MKSRAYSPAEGGIIARGNNGGGWVAHRKFSGRGELHKALSKIVLCAIHHDAA